MDKRRFSRDFLAQVASPPGLVGVLDHLPDVYFFAKDHKGRFVRCNQAFAGLARVTHEDEVIGSRDTDFFPPDLAENYMRDDRTVLSTAVPIVDKVELMRNADGTIEWYNTTKLPVLNRKGAAIGIAGITRDVKKMNTNNARFLFWAPVLETIVSDYAQPMSIAFLAAKVALSVSQFERKFKQKFQTTPGKYITNIRLNAACQLLVSTDLSISDIALQTGFYDQSHFANQFVRLKGTPPSSYRRKYTPPDRTAVPGLRASRGLRTRNSSN